MNSDSHKEDYQLRYINNKSFNPEEHTHVATLSKYDLFHIYFHLPSLKWKLIVKKVPMGYTSYVQEDEYLKVEYYEENSFDLLLRCLNNLIETERAYLISHKDRWWSFLPYWLYLDRKYINPAFVTYFKKNVDQAMAETNPEDLNDDEQNMLNVWLEETKDLK